MTAFPVTGGQRLRVEDVLLAGETSEGPALVNIEALIIDDRGLTIVGPRPGVERLVPWSEVSGFGGCLPASLPSGAGASALAFDVRGRTLRFLLPDANVAPSMIVGLDREIAAHLEPATPAAPVPATSPVAPTASASPVAPARPLTVEAPIAHTSPTPLMPPTGTLRPLGDPRDPVGGAPVPPRVVALPVVGTVGAVPETSPSPRSPEPVGEVEEVDDVEDVDADDIDSLVVAPTKREHRKRGVRGSRATVARPLMAVDEFEFSSDPSLPRGGPAPGAVIGVSRRHRATRRVLVLLVALVLVAGGATGWYYSQHHALPFLGSSAPPVNAARDLGLAATTVIQPPDLSGWTVQGPATEPFAMGSASSAAAAQASAGASGSLAQCLRVSPSTLSAATGAAGASVPAHTAFAASRAYADSSGDAAGSVTDVMDSSSVVQADAKVFANASLFATCYQPYVQAMLPYLSTQWGSHQGFDTATVDPTSVAIPSPGVHAYAFAITLFGHSGDVGTTASLTDIAVFGGRFQATMSLYSPLVFPVDAQSALVGSTESRVAAVADR